MKKFWLILRISILLFIGSGAFVNADNLPPKSTQSTVINNNLAKAKSSALVSRLNEIKSMDLENASSTEKKELRKEVKEINLQLKHLGNGFYISTGAVIIIILLLILIL